MIVNVIIPHESPASAGPCSALIRSGNSHSQFAWYWLVIFNTNKMANSKLVSNNPYMPSKNTVQVDIPLDQNILIGLN